MRQAMVLVIAMSVSCVHPSATSVAEFCGSRGMVFSGTTTTDTEDRSAIFVNGTIVPVVSRGSSESVSCRMPATQADDCQIKAASLSRAYKEDFGLVGRNLVIGVGWIAFVVPGLVAYVVFNGQRDDRDKEGDTLFDHAYRECMQGAH